MATLEEARKCPKCDRIGDLGGARPMQDRPGYQVINCYCRNPLCPWLDTPWIIQVNPDGSVPDPAPLGQARGEKLYGDPLTGEAKTQAAGITDAMIQKINSQVERLRRANEV
jgi:hypothetical protein